MPDKYEYILLDFDGVIAPDSPQAFVDLTYRVISKNNSIARETIRDYFRAVVSFSPWDAIQLFFKELGIEELVDEVHKEYLELISGDTIFGTLVDKKFFEIIRLIENRGINWKIVSLGSATHLRNCNLIKAENIFDLKYRSKADPDTFSKLADSLSVDPGKCLLIDDGILAIRAAKIAGLKTVFFQNNYYGIEEQYEQYKTSVDYRIFALSELTKIIPGLVQIDKN